MRGWENIASSRKLSLGWEQQLVAQSVDMLIGQRAQVIIGNGLSDSFVSLTTISIARVRSSVVRLYHLILQGIHARTSGLYRWWWGTRIFTSQVPPKGMSTTYAQEGFRLMEVRLSVTMRQGIEVRAV
ncbi:hypothetical protein C8Q80DRAFT_15408 [Daedaleopsis nitida]|nr:hypothetical protein C8Q80DRAFT_15408 [Daedaleopsis nitida]